MSAPPDHLSVGRSIREWWAERFAHDGFWVALAGFLGVLWQFVRDSTPQRRRQRYGDVDFDWENRVDTTSATVGWKDRLQGLLHSPYQPTEPALFRSMLDSLALDFRQFTFIDLGSGKGRTLLLAADYPFRRIVGVELLPALHQVAVENVARYNSGSQQCFEVESVCGDAREFVFPAEPLLLYLFNPLSKGGLQTVIENLEKSLYQKPRAVYLLYHHPRLAEVVTGNAVLRRVGGTEQYSIFAGGTANPGQSP
jgi:SAM-dependent methyltransferase